MRPISRHLLLTLLIPMMTGCPSAEVVEEPHARLDCETGGYPCSLDKVASDVLQRTADLSDQALAMLDAGSTIEQVLDFLKAQPDIAETMSSRSGLSFRLINGRDMSILLPEALAQKTTASSKSKSAKSIVPRQHVVGDSLYNKHALVLAPFQYYFGALDDGEEVALILQDARGYTGNVTLLENRSKAAGTVGLKQFLGWEDYDVIHATSHGSSFCSPSRCTSEILSGDVYSNPFDLLEVYEPGVGVSRLHGDKGYYLSLGHDFFASHYPGGLDRKIIFFQACQTFVESGASLSDALLGEGSVYLGWSESVEADAAKDAAMAFFTDMAKNGVTAQAALDNLGSLGINKFVDKGKQIVSLLLIDRDGSRDLRAREVVTLEHPEQGGELNPTANVSAVGTAQDGQVDLVPYQILVEGIPEDQQDAAVIQFIVEGHASYPQAVTIGERVGAKGWRLTGQIPYVDVATEQTVEMIATVQLPEGGQSEHRVTVNLTAKQAKPPQPPSESNGETWVGRGISHFNDSVNGEIHVTVEADVTFKQTSPPNSPFKRLEATGGIMHWSRSGTIKTLLDGDCAYSAGPIDVPILPGDGEILIDTRVTPNTYTLSGLTEGSEILVAENCGNYAFTTKTRGSWAPALGTSDGAEVSADGGTISGTTSDNTQTWEWTFTRQ